MSIINKIEVEEEYGNMGWYDLVVHLDKLPEVETACIHYSWETGEELHYGETADGFISFFLCGIRRGGHDEKYHWSSRDGVFNGLFGKKSIEVVYVVDDTRYAGNMTTSKVEELLRGLPYIVDIRKEYCWDNEVAYGIHKI